MPVSSASNKTGFLPERYRSYLRFLAASGLDVRLRAKVDASDIAQQTLLQAHRGFGEFRGTTEAEILAWLRKILSRNLAQVARDYRRDKRNIDLEHSIHQSINTSSARLAEWLAASEPTPSQNAVVSERLLILCAAMESLPEMQREAVRLHYCEQLKLKEIAVQMDRTTGSVAGLLKRGMNELRLKMTDEERAE